MILGLFYVQVYPLSKRSLNTKMCRFLSRILDIWLVLRGKNVQMMSSLLKSSGNVAKTLSTTCSFVGPSTLPMCLTRFKHLEPSKMSETWWKLEIFPRRKETGLCLPGCCRFNNAFLGKERRENSIIGFPLMKGNNSFTCFKEYSWGITKTGDFLGPDVWLLSDSAVRQSVGF